MLEDTDSKIGIGTYSINGELQPIFLEAWRRNCRIVDTAPNYLGGESQRLVGRSLRTAVRDGTINEYGDITVLSKVGFIPDNYSISDLLESGLIEQGDLRGRHCINPSYLRFQIQATLDDIGIEKLDLLFVHNPEIQFRSKGMGKSFPKLLRACFEELERACRGNLINGYGVATWDGFTQPHPPLILSDLVELAREVGGDNHGLQAIQLPISLVHIGAVSAALDTNSGPLVEAKDHGLSVFASSPLHGGELPKIIDPELAEIFGSDLTPAQACLLFTRSVPGVIATLTSPSSVSQLHDSLCMRTFAPLGRKRLSDIVELLS